MKKYLVFSTLFFFSIGLFACTCGKIKGMNGKFPGFVTISELAQTTLLIQVTDKKEKGVNVLIKESYGVTTTLKELFIKNMNPGFTCSDSTTNFKIGEYYLIVLFEDDNKSKTHKLSTCFESYINVTNKSTKAIIIDQINPQPKIWTREQLENKLGFDITNSLN